MICALWGWSGATTESRVVTGIWMDEIGLGSTHGAQQMHETRDEVLVEKGCEGALTPLVVPPEMHRKQPSQS